MPKSFTTPYKVGHWNGAEVNPFPIAHEQSQVFLEAVPVAHTVMVLQLPADPTDGDWYEYGDPLGLVGTNYALHIATTDGSEIDGEASPFITETANSGGKLVYDAEINSWVHTAVTP